MKASAACFTVVSVFALYAVAQQPAGPTPVVNTNTNYIDDQGTVHITRVIPVPKTLSPEAQRYMADQRPPGQGGQPGMKPPMGMPGADEWSKQFPNRVEDSTIAGVPVRIVTPVDLLVANRDKVLINLHAGGFRTDSAGSATVESIPVAGYARTRVISVLYRGVPGNPYPAAVDDVVAVYRELLKTYKPTHMVIFGSSAGAILTGEVAAKLKSLDLPEPAALGIFSGHGDYAVPGDSRAMYELGGFAFPVPLPGQRKEDPMYVGSTDPRDPLLSPIYSDLRGMPPTLFVTSERDMLLSGTSNLHRAFLRAGDDAELVVFDGLPHCFWFTPGLPESQEANQLMANFFMKQLNRK